MPSSLGLHIHVLRGLATNWPLWCFVVVNLSCLIRKGCAHIFTAVGDGLDELAIQRHHFGAPGINAVLL